MLYFVSLVVFSWLFFAAAFSSNTPQESFFYSKVADPAYFSQTFGQAILESFGFWIFKNVRLFMAIISTIGLLIQAPIFAKLARSDAKSFKKLKLAAWTFLFTPHILLASLLFPIFK
jgi:hypothetical protein